MWESVGSAVAQGGPWGLLALLVVFGWLIPRSTHRDRIADLKDTIATQKATIAEKDEQIAILLGRTREPAV